MSMESLNHLVAKSIMDPEVVMMFDQGKLGQVLDDMDFSNPMRKSLMEIEASNWAEFAVQAYRLVKADEDSSVQRIHLPSPLEGLRRTSGWSDQEQVA